MFNFIKKHLQKVYTAITGKLGTLFGATAIDEQTLKELELILIQADTGVTTTRKIIAELKKLHQEGSIKAGDDLKKALRNELIKILHTSNTVADADVVLLVGINGSGKTTCAAKLAYAAQQQRKKSLFVAADTFRAAAPEQLRAWALKTNTAIELGQTGQDPAAVVFAGCARFLEEGYDYLIIDTAGRLQAKTNLMKELEKIKRVIAKQLPNKKICTLLTIDAMLGQNSFEQAQLFNESTDLSGIILTKMDGTGKGGIVFAIADQLRVPIAYISYGESMDALKPFDAQAFVNDLLGA